MMGFSLFGRTFAGIEDLIEQRDDAPIIRLSNASSLKSLDIHVQTFEKRLVVRFRINGILRAASDGLTVP